MDLRAGMGAGADGSGVYPMYVGVRGYGGAQRGSERDRFCGHIGDRSLADSEKEKK